MKLLPGMIFCTNNDTWLSKTINAVQKFNATDGQSKYAHAGIIINETGSSYESLWTIRRAHIREYIGKEILIGRHEAMTRPLFLKGWANIAVHDGQGYPWWRLPLHLFKPIAKYASSGKFPVCSELACKFLKECGLVDEWRGKNPDDIADMIHKWRGWSVVFEGTLQDGQIEMPIPPCN